MFKVLLVDDEILVRNAIRDNINWNDLGFELVQTCENGKEAMEYIKKNPVDLLLTDILMPFVDGMQLSQFVYENFPETSIVIFSGFGEFEYAKKAISYHVKEYLLKPVTAYELSEVLKKLRKSMEEERVQEKKVTQLNENQKTFQKNRKTIAGRILMNLVMGTEDAQKCLEELGEFQIQIVGSRFRVAALSIDSIESGSAPKDEKKEATLMKFVVENVAEEILNKYGAGIAFQGEGQYVFLLLETTRPKSFLELAPKICREIQETIYRTMKMQISVCIGPYVNKPEEFSVSSDAALDAMDYHYILGNQILLDLEKEQGNLEQDVNVQKEIEQIVAAVKTNHIQKLEQQFVNMKEMFISKMVGSSRVILYLQQVLRGIYEEALRTDVLDEDDQKNMQKNTLIDQIADAGNYEEAAGVVLEYGKKCAKKMADLKRSSSEIQAARAMDYIQKNFGDPDLNLNGVCSYLSISTSRFSTIFKEATGGTFMEAVSNIRMEKAKELLQNTRLRTYEIAEKVGYSDPHYFSVAFKKMNGMTPTEYAKEKRK